MSLIADSTKDFTKLTDEELLAITQKAVAFAAQDRKEWQLLYYLPASPEAQTIHTAPERFIAAGGGNRSGKSDTTLAEAVIQATGVIPHSLKEIYPRERIRGPISVRVVCESLTTTLESVMLRKLRWDQWNGSDVQGGEMGHWGWIPKCCLIGESWAKSWKDKQRTLTVLCRDPDNLDRVIGRSTFQFMSHSQDAEDFASGEFHLVVLDEPPKYAVYRENRMRVLSTKGRMLMAMTWPDDPTIAVDWLFDEWYDKGQGLNKDTEMLWLELSTMKNRNIDQAEVARVAAQLSELELAARMHGKPIRFANRVHPLFTDQEDTWCFVCHCQVITDSDGSCFKCHSNDTGPFSHVDEWPIDPRWPCVYLLDPHPRKPHMMAWALVDANDDYQFIKTMDLADTPDKVGEICLKFEREMGLNVRRRLIDPNMGAQVCGGDRDITWQTEFLEAGLDCELANDHGVGRMRVDEYLKPDPHTRRPRLKWHREFCFPAIHQMKRFTWSDFKDKDNRDQKQAPKPKDDDYPALARYLLNDLPLCRMLKEGGQVITPPGRRRNGY